MKIEARAFGRGKKGTDVREKCGRLSFVAEGDVDAVQLAALYRGWVMSEGDAIKNFRKSALSEYCKKHNLTITVD